MHSAVVVGAGIGGVTAAVALQQQGWRVTVLERAPELGEVGAGLSIWPSAAAVLRELGVAGVEPGPAPAGPLGLRLPDGRWILRINNSVAPAVMIHRAELHRRVTDQFGPDLTVRTGFTVTGIEQDDTGATVRGGGEQLRADLVVAADGLRSSLRAALYPRYRGHRYAGYTAYRGLANLETDDGGGETWGLGRRFGFARLVDGRIYWYAAVNQAPGQEGDLNTAATLFADWHHPIPGILAGTTTLLNNDLYDLTLPLVPFTSGRVVLLGDAAHAMTPNLGRGACSAIEDAGALARQLAGGGSVNAALAGYDAERRKATARLLAISRRVGILGQIDQPTLGTIRDGALIAAGKLMELRRRS